jgi:hypothetical protein
MPLPISGSGSHGVMSADQSAFISKWEFAGLYDDGTSSKTTSNETRYPSC